MTNEMSLKVAYYSNAIPRDHVVMENTKGLSLEAHCRASRYEKKISHPIIDHFIST